MLGLVVRLEALRARPVAHRLPDRVPEVGREPALADVQHLVPAAGPMEAERGTVRRRRERVLHLVPVVERRLGRDDRLERRVLDSADPAERLLDLRRLRLELRLVREVLEPAASAGRVVLARRVDPRRSRLDDLERERFRVVALHPGHARADDVARQPAADEDDEAVQSRDAVPAVRERLDPEVELVVRSNGRGHGPSIGFGRGAEVRDAFDAAAVRAVGGDPRAGFRRRVRRRRDRALRLVGHGERVPARARGRRGDRLRRRAALVDPEQPVRDGPRPAGAPRARRRDTDLRGVVGARAARSAANRLWGRVREDDDGVARLRSATAASARPAASTRSCSTRPTPKPQPRSARRNRARFARRAARPRAGRLRGGLRGRRGCPEARGRRLRGPAFRPLARAIPRGARSGSRRDDRRAGRRRGRRLHGPSTTRRVLADRREHAHRGAPRLAHGAESPPPSSASRSCVPAPPGSSRSSRRTTRRTLGMRGVNASLGYRPAPTQIVVSGPLAT